MMTYQTLSYLTVYVAFETKVVHIDVIQVAMLMFSIKWETTYNDRYAKIHQS